MNCCDDYGKCKHGHGCPIPSPDEARDFDRAELNSLLVACGVTIGIAAALVFVLWVLPTSAWLVLLGGA